MNSASLGSFRRANLEYLIDYKYGSQTIFAKKLDHPNITQPTLSDILRKKRTFHDFEVKAIEEKLIIPQGWMDKDGWISSGWHLIEEYQKMNEKDKKFFNDTIEFVWNHHGKA